MSDAPANNASDLSPAPTTAEALGAAPIAPPAPSRLRSVIVGIVRWLARGLVLSTALVLLFSGIAKLFEPGEFAAALASHNLLPRAWVATPIVSELPEPEWATWAVASIETASGLGAVLFALAGRWRAATLAVLLMLAAFAGYAIALAVNPPNAGPVTCGCPLAPAPIDDWTPIALRNTLWALALLAAVPALPRGPLSDASPAPTPSTRRLIPTHASASRGGSTLAHA